MALYATRTEHGASVGNRRVFYESNFHQRRRPEGRRNPNRKRWITTQVYKEGLPVLLSYLEQHGMSRERVIAVCKGEKIETPPASEESSAFSSFREFLQKTMCRASASNYASSFRDLENILLKEKIISSPISESMCQAEVDAIRSFVKSDKAFIQYNKEHHYSRSAAWKKFEEYLASPSRGKK